MALAEASFGGDDLQDNLEAATPDDDEAGASGKKRKKKGSVPTARDLESQASAKRAAEAGSKEKKTKKAKTVVF